MRCDRCDGNIGESFRFCPWCAAPQRAKLVEHFRAHPSIETEPVGLRVSRYLTNGRHVRLSIWADETAAAAISLEEGEAARLAAFLTSPSTAPDANRRSKLRSAAAALWAELFEESQTPESEPVPVTYAEPSSEREGSQGTAGSRL